MTGKQYTNFNIGEGAKVHAGDTYYGEIDSPLRNLKFAEDAPFNSYAKQHEPACLPETRVDLLQEIYSWADGQDKRCIFWLNGLAGTGKSTIARTVARCYYDKHRLAASFFFSRGGGDAGDAGKFVTSLALQLARNVPALKQRISDAVVERDDIASQSLRDQWQHLVLRPLSKLHGPEAGQRTYIIVVDALDECDNDNNIRIIVQLLAEVWSLTGVRLRVLLTSRPEVPIRHEFEEVADTEHKDVVLHNISPSIVNHDIGLFLEHYLRIIAKECYQANDWPGTETIRQLVQNAGGLFIWAATACRFIQEGKRFAPKRLKTILDNKDATSITPERHLNEIYTTVLKNSIQGYTDKDENEEQCRALRYIVGSIAVLFSPLSTQSLSQLLDVAEGVEPTLEDLHAILDIPNDESKPVRLHHPSFRDFLLDRKRCGDDSFWVEESSTHEKLAYRCLELMSAPSGLQQDICNLLDPGVLRREIDKETINRNLPPELQYACRYWVDHLEQSQQKIANGDAIHLFLQKHFLHWFEAMSLIRESNRCVQFLTSLLALAIPSANTVSDFLLDAKRFALRFQPIAADAPLQLYSSALTFAPEKSLIRQAFEKQSSKDIKMLSKREIDWDACRSTLEGHSSWVSAVAFSLDGKLVASASRDKTVRLWDAETGAHHSTLEGHSSEVSVVAFSLDGKHIQTDRGDIALPSSTTPSPSVPLPQPSYIFVEDQWISIGQQRWLWLPPEFRPTCSAVNGQMVCLGHSSGRMSLFNLSIP